MIYLSKHYVKMKAETDLSLSWDPIKMINK